MLGLLYLIGCWLLGWGMTTRLAPFLARPERIAGGFFLGCQLGAWLPFLMALFLGFGLPAVGLGSALFLAIAWAVGRLPTIGPRKTADGGGWNWGWVLVAAIPAVGVSSYCFWVHIIPADAAGNLYSGGMVGSDLALHTTLIASFVRGGNVPPLNPVAPPYRLGYHFMSDFHSAILVTLGLDLRGSILLPDLLAYPALLVLAAALALRWTGKTKAAILAVILFSFNGGLAFLFAPQRARHLGRSWWGEITHPSLVYTDHEGWNVQFLNFLAGIFQTQRGALFGMGMGLLVLILLLWAVQNRARALERPLALAGLVAGLLPLFHSASYPVVIAVALWWSVALDQENCVRRWAWFFGPALALAVPQVLSHILPQIALGTGPAGSFIHWQPGWVMTAPWYMWPWFWLKNAGAVFLLVPLAWRWAGHRSRRLYAPFLVLFVLLNFFSFQPRAADNLKYFVYWYLATTIIVGDWLAGAWATGRAGQALVVMAVGTGTLAGIQTLVYEARSRYVFLSAPEVAAAAWTVSHTPPDALFLTSDYAYHPIPCLAGRTVVLGCRAWLWSWGFDTRVREQDVARMVAGTPAGRRLLREYGVSYLYIGSSEKSLLAPNERFLGTLPRVYRSPDGSIRIFQVTGPEKREGRS